VRVLARIAIAFVVAWCLVPATAAGARVVRLEIGHRGPAFDGRTFGEVGPYEELDGIAYGEVDPNDPHDRLIQDVRLAPRNQRGKVEYATDVTILAPADPRRGNHTIFYEVVNRGRAQAPELFNVGTSATNPAGDGFLERRGYTLVRSGWQGDLAHGPGIFAITVPVAHDRGRTITGVVRGEFGVAAPVQSQELLYAAASAEGTAATLTQRVHVGDPRHPIASDAWAFAQCDATHPFPGTPDAHHVCLRGGFDTNHLYELVYRARDPLVLGLGLAATRDVVSFLRHAGGTANPLAGRIRYALGQGNSQSGRFLRTFLQLGFNADEGGRIVFDGMNPHIADARIPVNVRFGQPARSAGVQHQEHDFPGSEAPTTWETLADPLARVTHGLLERCRRTQTCPKIVQTVTDTEYWQSAMSPTTAGAFGLRDLPIPANVRIYHLAGTQHVGYSPLGPFPPARRPACQQLPNANPYNDAMRALLVALTDWVRAGKAPPQSRYPRVADRTLVRVEQVHFPAIPGVSENLGYLLDRGSVWDRGPAYDAANVSGVIGNEPPIRIADYLSLVPQVDADGNDIDGVRSTTIQAPVGTYTGWNTRGPGFSEGDACDIFGSFIPFARTAAERIAAGDPRPSLEERYENHTGYVAAVAAAARRLAADGFLLPEDAESIVRQADAGDVLK